MGTEFSKPYFEAETANNRVLFVNNGLYVYSVIIYWKDK